MRPWRPTEQEELSRQAENKAVGRVRLISGLRNGWLCLTVMIIKKN